MGRLARVFGKLLVAALAAGALACSHSPNGKGVWHVIEPGDTLWRLSQRYEIPVEAIRDANDGVDARSLRVGQKLWMPRGGARRPGGSARSAGRSKTADPDAGAQCGTLATQDELDFEWPVLGHLSSPFGVDRGNHDHDGIDLKADEGTPIHAAETGQVVYAGDELGDYGNVVIIKHRGRWATVYAHNRKHLVDEGEFVEKGDVIAEVGETGNASTPHLHFEVRRNNAPRDPQSCLP